MPNTITINFIPCNPAPANGYRLSWRVAGTEDAYTQEPNVTESPATFTDNINPEGTCYEGFLQSDCSESGESGDVVGNAIPWATPCDEESGATTYTIALASPCAGVYSTYVITGGTPGDVIKVRATFSGNLNKVGGSFTRANLDISSPDGTPDSTASACYIDTAYHGFSITADSIITMVGTGTSVNIAAVTHNSSSSMSSLIVSIIEVNGSPVDVSTAGCVGNSSTGGDC